MALANDLATTANTRLHIKLHPGDDEYEGFWLLARDGSRTGVLLQRSATDAACSARLADLLQDFVHDEQLVAGGRVGWPDCLEHPGTHPMAAELSNGRAVWICPKTRRVQRPI